MKRTGSEFGILTKASWGKLETIRFSRELELRQDLENLKNRMGLVSAKLEPSSAGATFFAFQAGRVLADRLRE